MYIPNSDIYEDNTNYNCYIELAFQMCEKFSLKNVKNDKSYTDNSFKQI